MEKYIPEFLRGADNVYRTKHFIVKQTLAIQKSDGEDNLLISYDTYYRRTTKRDLAYNMAFIDKSNAEGRRLPSSTYVRTYVS